MSGKKKAEFPDAFIFDATRKYLEKHPNEILLVISKDSDWTTAFNQIENIIICDSISNALTKISKETITSVVHSLLSRSIFIKYLEERKDSNKETVFPQGFYSNFLESAKQYVSSDELPIVDFNDFECIVKNAREIFAAPHLIIKQSHKNGTFLSEVLDYDAVFNHSLLGVHGNINKLKYLSVIIGSRVFSYYHILTNIMT